MKKFLYAVMLAITLAFTISITTWGQTITRKGNTFVDNSPTREHQEPQKTNYTYQKGDSVWNVYLSSKGKAFIVRYSKRTGKAYKQYLPQISKAIENDQSQRNRQQVVR